MFVLANATMALSLSSHTLRVQLSVHRVRACWRSELGWDTPSRHLALLETCKALSTAKAKQQEADTARTVGVVYELKLMCIRNSTKNYMLPLVPT